MSSEYGFRLIDTSRPVKQVANELKRSIAKVIEDEPIQVPTALKDVPKVESQDKTKLMVRLGNSPFFR